MGGFIVGFAIKKISKFIAFLLGLLVMLLLYLGTSGIITINYEGLWNTLAGTIGFAAQAVAWVIGLLSLLPFMGGFLAGFLLGFKFG